MPAKRSLGMGATVHIQLSRFACLGLVASVLCMRTSAAAPAVELKHFHASLEELTKPQRQLARRMLPSVATVWSTGLCSGVLVAPELIATAWHCVRTLRTTHIQFPGEERMTRVTIIARDARHDLALLRLPRPSQRPVVRLAPATVDEGTPVLVIGHPRGDFYTVTRGRVLQPHASFLLVSAPVDHGNSGGPAVNPRGELVGIAIIRNMLIGGRSLTDCAGLRPLRKLMASAAGVRTPLPVVEADSSWTLDLHYAFDTELGRHVSDPYGGVMLGLSRDIFDRVRLGYRHIVGRPEQVGSLEVGYKFVWGVFQEIVPKVGRRFYAEQPLNAYGLRVRFFGLEFDYQRIVGLDGKQSVLYTVGL